MIDYREATECIKRSIDIKDLMQRYGVRVERDKVWCPFHNDKSPSMSIKYNRFYCFACGEKGDSIDFIQKWHNVDFKDAIKIIAEIYGLRLQENVKTPKNPKKESLEEWCKRIDKQIEEKYMAIQEVKYDEMCELYRTARETAEKEKPANKKGVFTAEFQKAINDIQYAEYWIDRYNAITDKIKRRHLYG